MQRFFVLLLVLLQLAGLSFVAGCGDEDFGYDEYDIGARPVDRMNRFPTRPELDYAMTTYVRDPARARAGDPMSVPEFFGRDMTSMNMANLRVERLKGSSRAGSEQPLAFLWARFHDTDMYWNNRYKDVQLFRLVDATGGTHNPFPEGAYVRHESSALVRIWTDYHPIKNGAPEGLRGQELMHELARVAVWSYVSGNVDGPATNANNGGFARFRDASGREFWRGVLIDAGAAWNTPGSSHKPWNTNLMNSGPVERANIPNGVVNSLIQIARASAEALATMSRFDKIDDGALNIVRGIRARAQEVLDHYGVPWQ